MRHSDQLQPRLQLAAKLCVSPRTQTTGCRGARSGTSGERSPKVPFLISKDLHHSSLLITKWVMGSKTRRCTYSSGRGKKIHEVECRQTQRKKCQCASNTFQNSEIHPWKHLMASVANDPIIIQRSGASITPLYPGARDKKKTSFTPPSLVKPPEKKRTRARTAWLKPASVLTLVPARPQARERGLLRTFQSDLTPSSLCPHPPPWSRGWGVGG